ncbi:malonyl-coenzyme A:anthocyanin 3-O-glucoside-6''-O-malonyltransferase-like [Canna indica]|uniref:Malonyl-coenzyme A:anthocyanin 3-O-glucoside-6''-O-malonyltransferase-like n=1 Tax=Canna indica TaxID=4628 RepID=A0AAQ3QDM2_9LILI|nr:malonyl-coenzyme A:anthocyanin 3-O-glucoside-6''-O-malonyltransferase-like [Canna indica]
MAPPLALRVLETCQVSPPPGSVAEASLPLTFLEIYWLYTPPVQRLFFYRLPPSTSSTSSFIDSVLPDLKSSLSLALHPFYPLAGKIRRSPGSRDEDFQYELQYADGGSVSFTVAEYEADFHDLCGRHARNLAKLQPLIPKLASSDDGGGDGVMPVMALQATVFPGSGVVVGVSVHHSACDGSSSMHFMASWASAFRSGGLAPVVPPPPIFDKSLCSNPHGLYSIYGDFIRRLRIIYQSREAPDDTANVAADDVMLATFILNQQQIKMLKELVLAKSAERETKPFHISTVVVVYSYVWTCLTRARGMDGEETSHLVFAADCRERMNPPLPVGYFGSCILPCFVEEKAARDLTEVDSGFLTACEATGRAIERFKDRGLKDAAGMPERLMSILSKKPMSVAGSPKLKVYDTDFGWGRPEKVEVISISSSGAISLAENRGEEAGVEIGLVGSKSELDAFGACFFDGLKALLG